MKSVRKFYFLEPAWHEGKVKQVLSRGIRLASYYEDQSEICIWRDPELYIFQLCPESISLLIQQHLRRPEIPFKQILEERSDRVPQKSKAFPRYIWSLQSRDRVNRIARADVIWKTLDIKIQNN